MNVRYLLEITVQGGKWLRGILKETWVGKHCRGALQKLKEDKVVRKEYHRKACNFAGKIERSTFLQGLQADNACLE